MKSIRNLFRKENKHSKADKENPHHHDQSHHVQFDDDHQDSIPPQRKVLRRRTSVDNFENLNPYNPAVAKPRTHRPVKSCAGKVTGNEYASSSDDDDQSTLVSQRTSYQKPRKRSIVQLQQNYKRTQINYCGGIQTSSEYGSGDPSPVNKHVAFESRFENEYYSNGSEYWKKKYRHYKDLCKQMNSENFKLHSRNTYLEEKFQIHKKQDDEISTLRKQNLELQSQIHLLNMKLHNYERNHYLQAPSAYPMLSLLHPLPNQFNNQQQLGGAGEQLASKSQIPDFRSSLISSTTHHGSNNNGHIFEEDETKNFRNAESSSDDPFCNSTDLTNNSYISSSTEEARGEMASFASPLRQTSSLTILQDDGYSSHGTQSNHSNQTLTTDPTENAELKISTNTEEMMKTPVKHRRVRFISS